MSRRVFSIITKHICGRTVGWNGSMGISLESIHILRKIPQRHFTRGSVLMKMKNAPRTKPLVKSRSMTTNVLISLIPCFVGIAICLEYERRKKIRHLREVVKNQEGKTPVPLANIMSKLKNVPNQRDLEFTKVELEGEFDHAREVFIGYRANELPHLTPRGAKWQKGVYVITPFKLKDTGETVLVNRGWVPLSMADPRERQEGQLSGPVKLTGLLRCTERKNPFDFRPVQDTMNEKFFGNLNVEDIADYLNTKHVFVDADVESSIPDGPVGGQTKVLSHNSRRDESFIYILIMGSIALFWYTKIYPQRAAVRYVKMFYASRPPAYQLKE
uniref:SURF1-like protein n=1 Tax=Crassostrea virginica TaxID=6565 RepID=A0A8B8DKI9_CRAVI|nr:surfeit locus protein 1-like [Crassostrea virginica]